MTGTLVKREDTFAETRIDDEVVLMDLANGDFFSIAGSALEIWELIDGQRDRDAILAEPAATFAMPPAELAGDLDAFLAVLFDAGYVTPA